MCEQKVRNWGLPHFGYAYATYRAVCARNGVYSSVACGVVDFNEQLTEPIYSSISVAWNEVFSSQLGESIEQFSKAVLDRLNQFFEELKNKLPAQGRDSHPVNLIQQQQMEAAQALLRNFILNEVEYIGKRQRGISRILTPEVQAHMKPIYAACNQLNGPGSFQRMKDLMQDYIHEHKQSMFSTATYKLQQQLELLKQYICGTFECVVQDLNKTLARQFEPMLKTVQKNDSVIPDLVSICGKVQQLCKLSCVDYVLPSPGHIGAGAEDAWESAEPPDFVGRCRVVRVGPWHLAHVASVQISVQETTIHFGGNMSLTVPFSSVYLCECCFHLYYLNLHVSPEGTRDIYSRWGPQAAPANLDSVEVLVVLETPEVPGSFRRLLEFISERRSGTAWFRELGLQQGREKLESLQVYYTATESKYALEEELAEVPASGFPENLPAGGSSAHQAQAGPWLQVNGRKRGADVVLGAEKRLRSGAGEQGPAAQPSESLLRRQQIPGSLELWGRSATPGDAPGTSTRSASAFPKHRSRAAALHGPASGSFVRSPFQHRSRAAALHGPASGSFVRSPFQHRSRAAALHGPASGSFAEVKREPEPQPLSLLQPTEPVSFTPSALLKVETCENQGQNAPDLPGAPRSARVFP
ncbi:PREDICTED: uncharacterized protein LOC104580510 [Tinamus guttatus]|uniref:uncharacterized protein LOC104580510 n=1 Tax=Tinamus guttatus TaxID=94827 RepID=UPI00052ED368|nr:PREDICTED: uncharacterized protein LOC104580510 [Tinamus guttatus]